MKLKKYQQKHIGRYLSHEIIIIIISIVFAFIVINHFSKRFNQVISPIAISETRQYLTMIINESTNNLTFNKNLFTTQKNGKNEIKMITYNSSEATKLINEITYHIQDRLNYHKNTDNNIVTEIPLGIVFNNGLLRNFGPKIKVKIASIGDIISELQTEVKPYGINNALVEVRAKITAHIKVVLPLISEDIEITNMIPISINIINGSIPEAYISTYRN